MRRVLSLLLLPAVATAACSTPAEVVSSSCESCHRPSAETAGIEEQHPDFALRCVECHGGDPTVRSAEGAHVANPTPGSDLRVMSRDALAAVPADYRRFKNPADPLVAAVTCGSSGPQGAQGCHQAIVDASAVSVHATSAGILNLPLFNAGLSADRAAKLGVLALTDVDFQPAGAPADAVGMLRAVELSPPLLTPTSSDAAALYQHALAKACTGCHLGLYGARGAGRPDADFAGGCAACHVYYADDALSVSDDPARDKSTKPHPARHIIERSVPDAQCERCHSRSLRIGTQYKGWRERKSDESDVDLRNAELVTTPIHGRPASFFVAVENKLEAQDLTPPDVHQARGLSCVDCHLAPDGHGDGFLHSTMKGEVSVRCQDCHGTFDAPVGELKTSGGAALARLRRDGDRVLLIGARDGLEHPVTQLVALRRSAALDEAHKTSSHGELECYACHTAWMQDAYALRRTLDLRVDSGDPLTGGSSKGVVSEQNDALSLGDLILGVNARGKITPFMVENALFEVIVPCNPAQEPPGTCTNSAEQPIFGKAVISGWFGRSSEGRRGFQWTPVFPHTTATRATVQPCERCHPRQFELSEDRVRATYGFGTGRYTAVDPANRATVDLTQMIDAAGAPVVALGHAGSGPVPMAKIQRALGYQVVPPLR